MIRGRARIEPLPLPRALSPAVRPGAERSAPRASRGGLAYLYLLPAFAVFALFVLPPLGHTIWLSFFAWDGLTPATWVGLDNYTEIFSDPDIRAAFVHAFILIVFYAILPICARAAVIAAL